MHQNIQVRGVSLMLNLIYRRKRDVQPVKSHWWHQGRFNSMYSVYDNRRGRVWTPGRTTLKYSFRLRLNMQGYICKQDNEKIGKILPMEHFWQIFNVWKVKENALCVSVWHFTYRQWQYFPYFGVIAVRY